MGKEKVIIILCDSLRAKSLPYYGSERNTTPRLDPFIKEDFTVYKRAYAPGIWTPPSHISLFTGLYPSQAMEFVTSSDLSGVFTTMAELFRDSNYSTCMISSNSIISKKLGYGKGFDTFLQLWLPDPAAEEQLFSLKGDNRFEKLMTLLGLLADSRTRAGALKGVRENRFKKKKNVLEDTTHFTDMAMSLLKKYISENSEEMAFCFLNLLQTHNRYNPPDATRNTFVRYDEAAEAFLRDNPQMEHYAVRRFPDEVIEYTRALYEEEILYLDIVISDFIDFLKETGQYDSTTLVITSDHGEHFNEHGHIAHGFSVYEPLIKIPLLIKWPGKDENRDKDFEGLVMLQDLYSTFVNLLDHWQPPPESSIDLKSSEKRGWALSQLDMHSTLMAYKDRHPSFSLESLGLHDEKLTAYILENGKKIIENGKERFCVDLESDPDEEMPQALTPEEHSIADGIRDIL